MIRTSQLSFKKTLESGFSTVWLVLRKVFLDNSKEIANSITVIIGRNDAIDSLSRAAPPRICSKHIWVNSLWIRCSFLALKPQLFPWSTPLAWGYTHHLRLRLLHWATLFDFYVLFRGAWNKEEYEFAK